MSINKIVQYNGFNYVQNGEPTISVNPPMPYAKWLNVLTGETFICTDQTAGANQWTGDAGTVVPYTNELLLKFDPAGSQGVAVQTTDPEIGAFSSVSAIYNSVLGTMYSGVTSGASFLYYTNLYGYNKFYMKFIAITTSIPYTIGLIYWLSTPSNCRNLFTSGYTMQVQYNGSNLNTWAWSSLTVNRQYLYEFWIDYENGLMSMSIDQAPIFTDYYNTNIISAVNRRFTIRGDNPNNGVRALEIWGLV